jgi:tetratricopeptide (TPR) repeat protein
VAGLILFVYGFWKKKEWTEHGPAATVQQAQTVRDVIAAEEVRNTTYNAPVYFQTPPPPAPSSTAVFPSLHQLPPPPGDFIGREEEIEELLTAVAVGGATISGLQGQGGVGKTALALKVAERLAPSFPDAQISIDLLGVSKKPLAAGEAMAYVIRAFQPEAKLPENEREAAGVYQSVLHGKRALLLMDNARDAAQVKPLIPPAGCVLLVTSRFHFVLPGLHAKNLETLPSAKAEELLLKIAPRIDGEAQAIAKLCGYLPQALRLAATVLAERVNMAPSDYRQRLAEEQNRPKLLAAGNESVEASISLSYGLLDAETQKRWRMLGVFPETFDGRAAAAVWSAEKNSAEDTLGVLTQYSMLEWNEKTRRYRLHDLMRDFARQKLGDKERYESSLRHAQHYLEVLRSADGLYEKGGDSLMSGLALFDLERGNVEAGQAWAKENSADDSAAAGVCSAYPDAGAYCLYLRQGPRERIGWLEAGLAAARGLGDRSVELSHLGNIGMAYRSLGEDRRAIDYDEQSLRISREVSDRKNESKTLGGLGNAYRRLGECHRAIEYHEQQLQIAREIGYRRGEGNALGNLGSDYSSLGEYRRAVEHQEQYAQIAREIGDRYGECSALWNMSLALDKLGDRKEAIKLAEASLKIHEEIEDPFAPNIRKKLEEWRKA